MAKGLSPRLMILMPPRHGKQVADSTRVPTPAGWTTHGELRPGSQVFGPDGRTCSVVAVSDKTPSDMVVTFTDGSQIRCHENHEWSVYDRSKAKWRVMATKDVARKLFSGARASFQLPTPEALQFPEQELPMDPYVLGAWLGDGSTTKPCITHAAPDQAVVDEIERRGYAKSALCVHPTTGVHTTYFSGPRPNVRGRMTTELQALGLIGWKRIPQAFRRGSIRQRLDLLAGLIDTDGHVERSTGRVRIVTVLKDLAADIEEVAATLGLRPYTTEQQPHLTTSGIQGRQVVYTVGFQPTMHIPVMLERKKLQRLAPRRRVGFQSVECAPNGEVGHCIQVDREDGLYLVGDRSLTVTHNSELASRMFPPWHLGRHPDHEIIACSYNVGLALTFSRKVKEVLEDPSYHTVFETRLNPNHQSAEEWGLAAGRGGYVAAGVGGGITGKGAHILQIDDPIKNAEEADSADVREKLGDWYGSTAYTRLAPGGGVLIIQTWWHDDDLAGRLQLAMAADPEADQFEVVKYPAIAEHDEWLDHETDRIVHPDDLGEGFECDEKLPTDEPRFTALRKKGEALHAARYDIVKLNRIKKTIPPRFWAALYQQNPVPDDGAYFTKDQFKRSPIPPIKRANVYIAWDFAISEKKQNDYTVGTVGLQDDNDVLHVAEVLRFKSGDSFFIVESILNLSERWYSPNLILGFEDGQIYRAIESLLKKRMRERRVYPSITVLKPITDKMARARTLQGRMQQGMVSFNEAGGWYDTVRAEMLRFPAGVHDDCVDSCAWMAQLAIGRQPPQKQKGPHMGSWRDRLKTSPRGGSHMAA